MHILLSMRAYAFRPNAEGRIERFPRHRVSSQSERVSLAASLRVWLRLGGLYAFGQTLSA
jgi:hypothetical protein